MAKNIFYDISGIYHLYMSQQIYNFIKFLEKKEGRTPPAIALIRYGTDEQKNDEGNQLAVVKQNPFNFLDILNKGITPHESVQIAAVKRWGFAIKYIIDKGIEPTEDVKLAAVEQDGSMIKFINNPSPKVKHEAYYQLIRRNREIPFYLKKYFD